MLLDDGKLNLGTWPATTDQQHRGTFARPGTQPAHICFAGPRRRMDDHDVERLEQAGDNRWPLLPRLGHPDEPFEFDSGFRSCGATEQRRTDLCAPAMMLGDLRQHRQHQGRRAVHGDGRTSPHSPFGKKLSQNVRDRQKPLVTAPAKLLEEVR